MINKELSELIDELALNDQEVQTNFLHSLSIAKENTVAALENFQRQDFKRNCKKCKSIFRTYGFPGISEVGKKSSYNFWLIVQHCDNDLPFQKQVLKAMYNQMKNKNVDPEAYAYLYDRVTINSGQKQKFGTQITYDKHGNLKVKDLESLKKVDLRRARMGLSALDDYLSDMKSFKEEQNS